MIANRYQEKGAEFFGFCSIEWYINCNELKEEGNEYEYISEFTKFYDRAGCL